MDMNTELVEPKTVERNIAGGLPTPRAPPPIPDRLKKEIAQATNVESSEIYLYHSQSNLIGRGAFSLVFKGYHQVPEKKAAVKYIMCDDENEAEIWRNEFLIWNKITEAEGEGKRYIVEFFEAAREINFVYFAMELADRTLKQELIFGDSRIYGRSATRNPVVRKFLQNVCAGLEFLHNLDIVHRDVKPENIFIFENVSTGHKVAKLGDFGLSRELSQSCGSVSTGKGTLIWMAPEALNAIVEGTSFLNTKAMDIFSLGLVGSYSIEFAKHPFEQETRHIELANIRNPSVGLDKPMSFENISADNLFCWMMQKSPENRPAIAQCRAHPYMWENAEEKSLQFLQDVVTTLKNPNGWKEPFVICLALDKTYRELNRRFGVNFDWTWENVGVDKRLTKTRFLKTRYQFNSLLSLVEFIVDTISNPTAADEEMFCENEIFNRKNCIAYFLGKFHSIVIFLFCMLVTVVPQYPLLKSLKEKYLGPFVGCEKNWADSNIVHCMKFFSRQVYIGEIMFANPKGKYE